MKITELKYEELIEFVEWMEAGKTFMSLMTSRQEQLISQLIEKDDAEIRGRIKELSKLATMHDLAIEQAAVLKAESEKNKKSSKSDLTETE